MFIQTVNRALWPSTACRCASDGGEWYNCTIGYDTEDFVRAICDAYTGSDTPAACL